MTTTRTGMQEGPTDFRFDFDRFERMFELGILNDLGPRIELLEGRIVEMSPIGGEHGDTSVDLAVALTNTLNRIPTLHDACPWGLTGSWLLPFLVPTTATPRPGTFFRSIRIWCTITTINGPVMRRKPSGQDVEQ